MPVPDFQALMLPTLRAYTDGERPSLTEVRRTVAESANLIDEDIQEKTPSGRQTTLSNRVSWAVIYMERAGLLRRIGRGAYELTENGRLLLESDPERIDIDTLKKYPEYENWRRTAKEPEDKESSRKVPKDTDSHIEDLKRAMEALNGELRADLLKRIRESRPDFLEMIVPRLLSAMGYGGSDPEMARVTGGTGDHGIDGTIKEDALGLDEVYVQAKRYAEGNKVGEGDLRNFAGAIDAAGTSKGVFVTTSDFTPAAIDYQNKSPKRIVLINGAELASLLIKYNVGVRTAQKYEVKRIDEDLFEGWFETD